MVSGTHWPHWGQVLGRDRSCNVHWSWGAHPCRAGVQVSEQSCEQRPEDGGADMGGAWPGRWGACQWANSGGYRGEDEDKGRCQ